jgi:hypothetical protein
VFDNVTNGVKAWLVGVFGSAINHTTRPEDRVLAVRWLVGHRLSRDNVSARPADSTAKTGVDPGAFLEVAYNSIAVQSSKAGRFSANKPHMGFALDERLCDFLRLGLYSFGTGSDREAIRKRSFSANSPFPAIKILPSGGMNSDNT